MKYDQIQPQCEENAELEPELRAALADFRTHVRAWSQTAMVRPRTAHAHARVWMRILGWSLGCALLMAGATVGMQSRRHPEAVEQGRMTVPAPQPAAETQPQAKHVPEARPEAQPEEEQLLASVDRAVARQVPSAMEPLAQLMADEEETR